MFPEIPFAAIITNLFRFVNGFTKGIMAPWVRNDTEF
jgi:hypothetical protein